MECKRESLHVQLLKMFSFWATSMQLSFVINCNLCTVNLQTFATAGLQSSATTVYISNHRVHGCGLHADLWCVSIMIFISQLLDGMFQPGEWVPENHREATTVAKHSMYPLVNKHSYRKAPFGIAQTTVHDPFFYCYVESPEGTYIIYASVACIPFFFTRNI